MFSIDKEWSLLEEIGFIRVGGSEEELKAAKIIQKYLKDLGLKSKLEHFDVKMSEKREATLEVTKPYKKEYKCSVFMNSADVDELEAELVYVDSYNEVSLKEIKGKVVLVNGYVGAIAYDKFIKYNPAAFISFNGEIDFPESFDLAERELREPLHDAKIIPGINILVSDAMDIVKNHATKVKITTKQKEVKAESTNVICDIKGYEGKQTICFTAHYDSVPESKGYYDNGTGAVSLYSLAEYFSQHQPRHNVRFIFTGSEERGLLGSKAYVKKHQKELEDTALCINVDMIGSILGNFISVATADNSLVNFIDYYGKMNGISIDSRQGVYSSDSTPFADSGVPAVSFARITPHGAGQIHCRYDVIEHLSKDQLQIDTEIICKISDLFVNSYVVPVPKEMPQNMKDDLDKYLGRKAK